MFCRSCGKRIPDDSSFCPVCGKPVLDNNDESVDMTADNAASAFPDASAGTMEPNEDSKAKNVAERSAQKPFAGMDAIKAISEQKQIKRAYFWYKLEYFFAALATAGIAIPLAINGDGMKRLLTALVLATGFGLLSFCAQRRNRKMANLSAELTDEEEAHLNQTYENLFGKKLKWISGIGTFVFFSSIFLFHKTYAWGLSLKLAFLAFSVLMVILMAFWAFKFLGILIVALFGAPIIIFGTSALLGMVSMGVDRITQGGTVGQETRDYDSAISQNSEIQSQEAEILRGEFVSEGASNLLVVAYAWTNTSDHTQSAMISVIVKAYQGGIELEPAYFADVDSDLASKDIRPGVRVEIEKAFYLREKSDVEVEITPYVDFYSETVYAKRVFAWPKPQTEYSNGGIKLTLPSWCADSLFVETPQEGEYERKLLFTVYEKSTYERGLREHGGENWGDGELFSVLRMARSEAAEAVDIGYGAVFAKDNSNQYYVFCVPTDYRFTLADRNDQNFSETLSKLENWAEKIPDTIIMQNPQLTSYNFYSEAISQIGSDDERVMSRFTAFVDNCDERYFSREDLNGFNKDMAMLARNAPYAHAGRKFNNDMIRGFFESKSWYYPYIEPDAFHEEWLNDYERANKELVMAYEKEMGYK